MFLILIVFNFFLSFAQIPQIDVKHYRIQLYLSNQSDEIKVDEVIEFVHLDQGKSIVFNLASVDKSKKGMRIKSLRLNGKTPTFKHKNDSIYIASKGTKTKTQTLKLSFEGIPKDGLIIGKNKYG